MVSTLEISRVGFIVLREMRRPIMVLLTVYGIAVFVMTLIPGKVIDGRTYYMSIFHAFYFMTYTATTTGFGEIPHEFSEAQRLWAIICLYVSVVTWFYAIGSIVHLIQNPYFQQALAERNFVKQVQRIPGRFFIICGFGDTGSLLARGLSDAGIAAVIIEKDDERIKALWLRNYNVAMPGLCADASIPKHLLEAGIQRSNCKAVIAITNDEEVNLKISAIARLLNPGIRIVTLSKMEIYEETLATLGSDIHIVDPFKTFAKGLSAIIYNPLLYTLNEWMIQTSSGVTLSGSVCPPRGTWVICGYGRLGHEVARVLAKQNIPTAIIDPHQVNDAQHPVYIVGRTTAKTLRQAGIDKAAGLLAGTDDDGHNLGIIINARRLNANLFTVVRQNRHENEIAFNAANADIIMQPSLVTARRILFFLIAPLVKPFFQYLIANHSLQNNLMQDLIVHLQEKIGDAKPHLWSLFINRESSPAVWQALSRGKSVVIGDLLRDPRNREEYLATLPLVIQSGTSNRILPTNEQPLKLNDQILLCGKESAHKLLESTLYNEYSLHYVQTGEDQIRSALLKRWLQSTA